MNNKLVFFYKLIQQLRQSVIFSTLLTICEVANDIQLKLCSCDGYIEHLS